MLSDIYMENGKIEEYIVGTGHTFRAVQDVQSFPVFPVVPFFFGCYVLNCFSLNM